MIVHKRTKGDETGMVSALLRKRTGFEQLPSPFIRTRPYIDQT